MTLDRHLATIARALPSRLHRWGALLAHPRPTRAWFATALATFTVAGILYFFAAVTAEELLRPFYDPVQRTISELAVGPFGFLQTSAFVALGLSLLALQHALYRRLRHTMASSVALALIGLCGLLSFAAAAFPTDLKGAVATAAGTVHELAASIGYAGLIIAMILLSLHFRRDDRWRAFARPSSGLAVLGVVTSIVMGATSHTDVSGLSQRLMVVPLLSWVVWTALHARSAHVAPAAALTPPQGGEAAKRRPRT